MLKITYFVHGTTTDNENDLATGWAPGELSKLGIEQSKKLSELTKNYHFDVVFCSDLKRAINTANIAFGEKYKIIQDERLREANYGDYTQKSASSFKNELNKFIDNPFPNGESYKQIEKRLLSFIEEISKKFPNQHIAIVTHQAPQLALDVILKNKTWEQAIKEDWRNTKSWQPGWDYIFTS